MFLINTLGVSQSFVSYSLETMIDSFAKTDERGIVSGGANKTSADITTFAEVFIVRLPLLPSHYCRKNSTCLSVQKT